MSDLYGRVQSAKTYSFVRQYSDREMIAMLHHDLLCCILIGLPPSYLVHQSLQAIFLAAQPQHTNHFLSRSVEALALTTNWAFPRTVHVYMAVQEVR
jgi:hypothetical protein